MSESPLFAPGAAFLELDGAWYRPTDHCRGPWDPDACHGGPPAGAIARELELLLPDHRLTRLTADLVRPVPHAGFRIEASTVHEGRSVATSTAELIGEDGRVCMRATGLHMRGTPLDAPTLPADPPAPVAEALPGPFPIDESAHDLPGFNGDGVRIRYPVGEDNHPGPTTAWMATVPIVASETPSPFQRMCPLGDTGNALGRNAQPWDISFINPDLTIVLHRDPVGDWLGSEARCHWQPNGIGLADARLFDREGTVGRALQTLLLRSAG